ncbi:hypothetical protein ACFL0W_01795 [Nanoarchaeota archaeon]
MRWHDSDQYHELNRRIGSLENYSEKPEELLEIVEEELSSLNKTFLKIEEDRKKIKSAIKSDGKAKNIADKIEKIYYEIANLIHISEGIGSLHMSLFTESDKHSELPEKGSKLKQLSNFSYKLSSAVRKLREGFLEEESILEQVQRHVYDIDNIVKDLDRLLRRGKISAVFSSITKKDEMKEKYRVAHHLFNDSYKLITEELELSAQDKSLIEHGLVFLAELESYLKKYVLNIKNLPEDVEKNIEQIVSSVKKLEEVFKELSADEKFVKLMDVKIKTDLAREAPHFEHFLRTIDKFY